MALKRLTIEGYGQVELNNCAFRRDGRIEAQCKPNATDFSQVYVENGMLLAVDNVAREVKFADPSGEDPIALVYTAEHIYDERTPGLKNFYTQAEDDFLPRLGYLAVGDKYTTNCICYESTEFSNDEAVTAALASYKATPLYAGVCENGAHLLTASAPTQGPVLKVIKNWTMPDGTPGVQFQVYAV